MALLLTVGAVEGRQLEATLEHIAPKGVEEDGAIQFEIRAALKRQSDVLVRANYSANADIVLDRRDSVLAINESLLKFEDGKQYVEVETAPQKFEKREIQTGLRRHPDEALPASPRRQVRRSRAGKARHR